MAIADAQGACRARMLSAFDMIVDAVDDAAWELGRLEEETDGASADGEALQRGVHAARAVIRDGVDEGGAGSELLDAAANAWETADETSAWPAMLRGFAQGLANPGVARADDAFASLEGAVRKAHEALSDGDPAEELSEAVISFSDDFSSHIAKGADTIDAWGHAAGVAEETAQESAAENEGLPEPHAVAFAIVVGAVYDAINA